MIPVVIAPVYSRADLLHRCLASVDVPVGQVVVVDNSPTGLDIAIPQEGGVVLRGLTTFGYTGSINMVIGQTPDAPWWLWTSNDIAFGAGDLAQIAALMEDATGPRLVTDGFNWGALNAGCVEAAGLFDEWLFWPIYYDDNDYAWRCKLAGVEWVRYVGNVLHGEVGRPHSVTIADPDVAAMNAVTWNINRAAYIEKWGGAPGHESFTSPYNSGQPVWATRPSPSQRSQRIWRPVT